MQQLKYIVLFVFFLRLDIVGQSNKISTKSQGTGLVISSASNVATVSGVVYTYSIGESVIFTGGNTLGFLTQGFQQPMICRTFPVIVASNQQSCALPYTLQVTNGFNRYQWKVGNSIIANGKSDVYLPIKDGLYSVTVGDSTGCVLNVSPIKVDLSAKNIVPSIAVFGINAVSDTLLTSSLAASYQWYVILPDGSHKAIVGATRQSYRPLFKATYYVKINTIDFCESFSAPYTLSNNDFDPINKYNFEQTDTSIDIIIKKRILARKLSVYPIPSRENFNIDYESPEKNEVVLNLYNVLGVMVSSRNYKNVNGRFTYRFDRGDLPSGRYVLNVVDGEEKLVESLVIE